MSDPSEPPPAEQKPPCPYCGSHNVGPKGRRHGRWRYRCKVCRHWFKEDLRNELDHDDTLDVFDVYFSDVTALDRINKHTTIARMKERGKDLPKSKTKWSDFLIREAECLESGADITRSRRESMSGILVIDSMHRKIEKKKHYIWIAIDALRGEPVHYDVTSDKTLPTVIKFLYELRLKGDYEAIIVLSDQEAAILAAVRLVFPHAKLVGCVVHRMRRLYKKLRTTQRKGRRINPERLKIRAEFTELARRLIHSTTPEEKQRLTEQMKSGEPEWATDPQTLIEYKSLMANLRYYLTAQERGEAPDNTNQCESANDLFSQFVTRRQGFKNLRAARAYLKAFFAVFRLKRNGAIGRRESLYLLPPVQSAQPEPAQLQSHAPTSQQSAPELGPAGEDPQANKDGMPVIMDEATTDGGKGTLDQLAQSIESLAQDQRSESRIQDNLAADSTQDKVLLKVDQEELQKFKDTEAEMLAMMSSAEDYNLKSSKAYVNRFETLARKFGFSPCAIAINKIDGSLTKLTNKKRKSSKRCRVKSVDADNLSRVELECMAESASQMINALNGSCYQYADVKSYANEFYRIINKRGRSPASSTISKQDGRIIDVN